MSSSPLLPSPSELFKQKRPSARQTGSCAASIPLNSPIFFTTAATLLKESKLKSPSATPTRKSPRSKGAKGKDGSSELLELLANAKVTKPRAKRASLGKKKDTIEGEPAKAPRKTAAKKDDGPSDGVEATKPKSSRAKKVVVEDGEEKVPVPRKPRAKKAAKDDTGGEPPKEKPARKPRAKKAEVGQTKILKGRVTKKLAAAASEKLEGNLESNIKDYVAEEVSKTPNGLIDYGLPKAVKRRTDWSPVKASTTEIPLSPTSEPGIVSPDTKPTPLTSNGFGNLLGDYGFAQSSSAALQREVSNEEGTRKRKLIELVKTNVSATSNLLVETPLKAKAPRKKARTITDVATSAYAKVESDTPAEPGPLLQYFSPNVDDGAAKVPTKARKKAAPKATKAKKSDVPAPMLLSPTSALNEVWSQDFVFGTSSQLARDESPTYLRDLHMAMQESNAMMCDPFDDPFVDSVPEPSAPASTKVRRKDPKGALWSAAARDTKGSLLDVEVVDLIDSPVVKKPAGIQEAAAQLLAEDEWHDVEEVVSPKAPAQVGPEEPEVPSEVQPSSPKRKAPSKASSPKRPKVLKDKDVVTAPTKTTKKAAKTKQLEMPDYDGFTTAQLASQIASYHFKPIKSRSAMISLLEQCWEEINRTALKDLATNTKSTSPKKSSKVATEASTSKATTPKRPVGRPRKDSSVNTDASPVTSKAASKAITPKRPVGRPRKDSSVNTDALPVISKATSEAITPKRPVGRPRKDGSTSPKASPVKATTKPKSKTIKEKEDEDLPPYDSDTPLSILRSPFKIRKSHSPRRQTQTPRRSRSSSPKRRSPIGNDLTPASDQATLFKHITRAIKSLPPSRSSNEPNWQEKILMFDPIVIEDLTAWLNTAGGPLGKTGWDAEVGTKEVKRWCEGRGICCLWKENLRGGSRARF